MTQRLEDIVGGFALDGAVAGVTPFKSGHINDTFRGVVRAGAGEKLYIHQRINHRIFKDVPGLMRNIAAVTDHIRGKLAAGFGGPDEVSLRVVPARSGELYLQDEGGSFWRTYEFIPNCVSVDVCASLDQAREAGRMVGKFQRYLRDFPAHKLVDPIPQFQNTALRFQHLEEAIREDRAGRVKDVSAEIDFVRSQKSLTDLLVDGVAAGSLPLRVTHGDPKLNNILFSERTGKGICLVDLDTCMAGTALYDFGDLVRCTAVQSAEDELDLSKVRCDLSLFRALTEGVIEIVGGDFSEAELALLAVAPQCIVATIGIRFLTDHLNGDVYFKIHRPGHNLDRARTQFALVRSIQTQSGAMERTVEEILRSVR